MQTLNLNPVHLSSMQEICDTFKKSRKTVKKWFDEGAPIMFDGRYYSSEYNNLRYWLIEHSKNS